LLLHAQNELLRTSVAYTLWPDEPETKARSNLRRDLHRLQSLLPPTPAEPRWLLLKGERLRWNPDAPAWIDALEFDRLAKGEGTLEEAVAHYRGDLLEGIYDDWVLGERERYQARYLGVLTRLAHVKREARARGPRPGLRATEWGLLCRRCDAHDRD
jgi:DNA-binding SARP family transcriptional activator